MVFEEDKSDINRQHVSRKNQKLKIEFQKLNLRGLLVPLTGHKKVLGKIPAFISSMHVFIGFIGFSKIVKQNLPRNF